MIFLPLLALSCAFISDEALLDRMDLDQDGVARPDDCDDGDSAIGGPTDLYPDADGDGAGTGEPTQSCDPIEGYVANSSDCDDLDGAVTTRTWYEDADGDGYGALGVVASGCSQPHGYVEDGTDCDDTDAGVSPAGEDALNNGMDEDCDGWERESYFTAFGSEMRSLPAGTFTMGGGRGDPDGAETDHPVTLTRPFWIGRFEVTQAEWAAWTSVPATPGSDPSAHAGCDECPVEQVSWHHVAQYANALSAAEGLEPCYDDDGADLLTDDPYACSGYRLPTEAEWEYAARAGVDTSYSGSDDPVEVAWHNDNSGDETHEVGTLAANAWGLSDMSGNVWEWTNDWDDNEYGGYGTGDPDVDPPGPTSGDKRIVRGGGFYYYSYCARVAFRASDGPSGVYDSEGFRLVRTKD